MYARQNEPDAMDEDPLLEEVDAAPLMLIDKMSPMKIWTPIDPEPRPEEEPEWKRPMTPDLYSVTIKAMLVPRVVGWRIVLPVGAARQRPEAGHQSVENHCRFRFRPDEIALLAGVGWPATSSLALHLCAIVSEAGWRAVCQHVKAGQPYGLIRRGSWR